MIDEGRRTTAHARPCRPFSKSSASCGTAGRTARVRAGTTRHAPEVRAIDATGTAKVAPHVRRRSTVHRSPRTPAPAVHPHREPARHRAAPRKGRRAPATWRAKGVELQRAPQRPSAPDGERSRPSRSPRTRRCPRQFLFPWLPRGIAPPTNLRHRCVHPCCLLSDAAVRRRIVESAGCDE